jgi:lipopolysaccharide biosynthesis glycosyltransferase
MEKTVVVTTCSANHLAQAKGMGDSLLRYNPDYKLLIGLVDKLQERKPANYYAPHDMAEAHELNIPQFDEMLKRYDVFELNCALKIFFVMHAFKKYAAERVIFLDSDILVFDSLQYIEDELDNNSILLTPHILTPFEADGKRPYEREMLKNGIFNGGFFALRNDEPGKAFLNWWKERMTDQCYVNLKEGMFVDQKWLNLAPLYFSSLKWLQHPGCNMAYWNLHERKLAKADDRFSVNGQPLLFFHFSGYSMQSPDLISRHQDRISMNENSALKELFNLYHTTLLKNNHLEMLKSKCYYTKKQGILQKLGLKK